MAGTTIVPQGDGMGRMQWPGRPYRIIQVTRQKLRGDNPGHEQPNHHHECRRNPSRTALLQPGMCQFGLEGSLERAWIDIRVDVQLERGIKTRRGLDADEPMASDLDFGSNIDHNSRFGLTVHVDRQSRTTAEKQTLAGLRQVRVNPCSTHELHIAIGRAAYEYFVYRRRPIPDLGFTTR